MRALKLLYKVKGNFHKDLLLNDQVKYFNEKPALFPLGPLLFSSFVLICIMTEIPSQLFHKTPRQK